MDSFDLSWMVGRTIKSVVLNEPTEWAFSFEPGVGVGVECPWRLLKDGSIAVSSEDHLQQYGLPAPINAGATALSLVAKQRVTGAEVRSGTADLILKFENGMALEVIPFSSGYESWGVTTPSGFYIFAQGGGQLSGCRAEA